jgi:ATP-dependent Clp protease ATP-binding subunit ClpA
MADPIKDMTDWDQLKAMLDKKADETIGTKIDEAAFLAHLRTRVKGQDVILEDVVRLIRLQAAKKQNDKPIANLLFLGPTGTGKTELAKAIAEYLFKDENAMLRFDCSELSGRESKTRLIGTPTGYVGHEQGGQLTRPVMANPRRLILFDEIEKAYPPVFDLFLQLLGEGRLTEQGSGKAVNFTQCVFILTSNAHAEAIGKIQAEMTDYHEMVNAVKSELAEAQVFRPEILGRIDKVYVFKPLEGIVVAEIALLKIGKLAQEYGLQVHFVAPELIVRALLANEKVSRFGIRELERILFDLFAGQFIEAKEGGAKKVDVDIGEDGNVRVRPTTEADTAS